MTVQTIPTTARGHQLGADISTARNLDQALNAAGLNWGIKMVDGSAPMTILTDDGVITTTMPGRRMAMRDDNYTTLGVVGGKYTAVDNRSVFSLGEHLTAQGATPARGGELDHGRQVFMTFDFPNQTVALAGGKDLVTFGATVRASHDGTGKVVAEVTGKRLWCTNGCTVAIKGIPNVFSVAHTASAEVRIREAQKIMAGAGEYVAAFTGAAERMLSTKMTPRAFGAYIDTLFPKPAEDAGKREVTLWEQRRAELVKLYKFADTNELGRGTRWGAFNSVTEYLDWGSSVRQGAAANVAEARALRQFANVNQDVRDRAFAFALAA